MPNASVNPLNGDDCAPLTPSEWAELARLSHAFTPDQFNAVERELCLHAAVRGWTGDPLKQPARAVLTIARRVHSLPRP